LAGSEVPREVLVSREPFTRANGLLSDAGKYRRPIFRERYGVELAALYAELAARRAGAQREAQSSVDAPVEERVRGAVAAVLGRGALGRDALRSSFVRLGGDSLSAVQLRDALCAATGARIDVADLLAPDVSLAELLPRLGKRSVALDDRATFEAIHGNDARWARAQDLELARFLPEALLAEASRLPLAAERRHYLLTGASGFLGHVVLAELLTRLDPAKAAVTCIVRADRAAAAHDRLARRIAVVSSKIRSRFEEWSAASRLRVLAGDLTAPRLGLNEAAYARLSESVDVIVHAGALVNHVLPYAHLFAPNVYATAQIMRLAIERQRKRVHFVSTSGVAAGLRRRGLVLEAERAAALWARRPIGGSAGGDYALGYSTSKWASEVMLAELHERCAVPVSISRCSMILPHRESPGVHNAGDAFARLLYGIVRTGVAPHSFYADGPGMRGYDGLPVDLVARVIVEICASGAEGFQTYHVCNDSSADGASLDTFVDWAQSCGYRIERLDHSRWHAELLRRLARLPREERQRSPEPIAFRWREPLRGRKESRLDATEFRAALQRLGIAAIPPIEEAYFHRCLHAICGDAQ
jgi:fatty acid CoA ligase FadD9